MNNKLKIAFSVKLPMSIYDSAKIEFAVDANIIRAIYSPLIEYDREGELIPGLAESFTFESPTEVHFKIRSGVRTVDGHEINAEDAYFSFLRLLIKNQNTHGSLKSFICPSIKLEKITDICDGLSFNGNTLVLKVVNKNYSKFLLPLLASVDFSIIPKSSIDWTSDSLKIIDYKNTSGPFYVFKDDPNGEFLFKANLGHYNINEKSPHEIEFVTTEKNRSIDLLNEKKVDLITTFDPVSEVKIDELKKNISEFNVHESNEIKLTSLKFTENSTKKLSLEQRLLYGHYIRLKMFSHSFFNDHMKPTDEFFASFGEGGLSDIQKTQIKLMWSNISNKPMSGEKISVSVWKEHLPIYEEIFKDSSFVKIVPFNGFPDSKPLADQEDAFIIPGDTGFFESISLISYYLMSSKLLPISRQDAEKWIENYMAIEDKSERLNLLKKLHFDILSNVYVVPIAIRSYVAVARKPWNPKLYKFFAGTPLWMLEIEN